MATIQTTTNPGLIEEGKHSAVNWGAVIAGSVTTAALTLVLLAFGAGVGFPSYRHGPTLECRRQPSASGLASFS